jgi:pyrroline-5-carboxylate reductase
MTRRMRLGVIGAGNVGTALIRGAVRSNSEIIASDVDEERLSSLRDELGIETTTDNVEAAKRSDMVLLAVTPQIVEEVLSEIREELKGKSVISIAAGVSTSFIESMIPEGTPVIRAMPNIAAMVGEAATALAKGKNCNKKHYEMAKEIFEKVGKVVEVGEELMDAVTGLSGTGPMYIFVMVEALSDAGVKAGLPRKISDELAIQTLYGSSKMARDLGWHPATLRDLVTSPGGTAISALHSLERDGFKASLMEAVEVATRRSSELGKRFERR